MRYCLLFLLVLLIPVSSCQKLGFCRDTEFNIDKAVYSGTQLRVDGFYYGGGTSNGVGGTIYNVLIFYRNGIVYLPGGSELANMETYVSGLKGEEIKKVKSDWGVYSIDGNVIKIERWPNAHMKCNDAELRTGTIEEDTVFVFNKKELRTRKGKIKKSDISERYHFRQFTNKPDSSNNIIP